VLVVELAEPRIDPDRERMRAQESRAEAVDRRDPGAVETTGEIGATATQERGADPRPELARRLAGVGDDEHRLDVEALVAHRLHEPLDKHGRLARACAGRDEHLAVRFDSCALLSVHGHT
jgi:hypothetical protein